MKVLLSIQATHFLVQDESNADWATRVQVPGTAGIPCRGMLYSNYVAMLVGRRDSDLLGKQGMGDTNPVGYASQRFKDKNRLNDKRESLR